MSRRRVKSRNSIKRRGLRAERLEARQLMAADLHNEILPQDVNSDGEVSAADALVIVNYLTQAHSTPAAEGEGFSASSFFASGNLTPQPTPTPVETPPVETPPVAETPPTTTEPTATTPRLVDVNNSGSVTASDALAVINFLSSAFFLQPQPSVAPPVTPASPAPPTSPAASTTDGSTPVVAASTAEAELPVDLIYANFPKAATVDSEFAASFRFDDNPNIDGDINEIKADEVRLLLDRASAATRSDDGIIAVVDRNGTILGVRVEAGVSSNLTGPGNEAALAYAIDGAVAKARTAAFFSSNSAPLTSRTIRSLSQSTNTQREVEASPVATDARFQGPGLVGPIGVGGKFPPEVNFTPQVDLFAIEHQSRDSQLQAGADGVKGTADDFALRTRFNANPAFIPTDAEDFFQTWPEAYGVEVGTSMTANGRGIATLPGGIPLFKAVTPGPNALPLAVSESVNLVGGIGVFFPGEDGYASFEQGFEHGVGQSEKERTNADKVLEAEFAAFIAAAGGGIVVGNHNFARDVSGFNANLPALPNFVLPNGRIDLVGITLEIYGPNPTRTHRMPGIDRLLQVGQMNFGGTSFVSGTLQPVNMGGDLLLDGKPVPQEWLVAPHSSTVDPGLTAEVVDQIITTGIEEANRTRAAIRLDLDNGFRPGARTRMVLSVTDTSGELLGLYRMPDATIFSIDVAVAKARNTAYYADPLALQPEDRLDANGDGVFGSTSKQLGSNADTVPVGTAFTNRTFRFVVEPRFPSGVELSGNANHLQNDPNLNLCDQDPILCSQVTPQSILQLPGIDPFTGENLVDSEPLPFDVYANGNEFGVLAFDSFVPTRNFRDTGDASVVLYGTGTNQPLANQNGIVFFPGSTPLYLNDDPTALVGGFGVSGDGVDQDDIVTAAGQQGFAPPQQIRVDDFVFAGVRLPFQKFNRNPFGP
ncbi:MAG: hypothetical protein AB8B91_20470 [Rubripirellula sp.]